MYSLFTVLFKEVDFELKYEHTPMPNQSQKTETLAKLKTKLAEKLQSQFDEADDGNKSEEGQERRIKSSVSRFSL